MALRFFFIYWNAGKKWHFEKKFESLMHARYKISFRNICVALKRAFVVILFFICLLLLTFSPQSVSKVKFLHGSLFIFGLITQFLSSRLWVSKLNCILGKVSSLYFIFNIFTAILTCNFHPFTGWTICEYLSHQEF